MTSSLVNKPRPGLAIDGVKDPEPLTPLSTAPRRSPCRSRPRPEGGPGRRRPAPAPGPDGGSGREIANLPERVLGVLVIGGAGELLPRIVAGHARLVGRAGE